ncbi:phage scaffolding protein [Apilactobacillus timberlakei]|uniref:Phage minor capsid protein n=1 Tax=Apilactobacillus timberlakei TaxID=2008380 RepID=A0ABY2YVD8_9LACO|nr:phage scaffolding protein [Apilactobacillus timberlakei]TPR12436.1 hypothetical protein DY048_07755 [Apilactobacillus timberlakei]TPR12976.1 hypothetical protein DY052_08675 [Apilactobacillus timberlakei]
MKRSDLKDLGLDDSSINAVMKLHGQSINEIKGQYSDYDELKAQNSSLNEQITKNDKDLKALQGKVKDNDQLHDEIKSLRKDNDNLKQSKNDEISKMKLNHAIDSKLSDYKVRNNKTIKPLLDMDSIELDKDGNLTGLDNQMETIQKDENNAFLFDKGTDTRYNPQGGEGSGATKMEAFKEAFGLNNDK